MFRLVGASDDEVEAEWHSPTASCTISQIFCASCGQSNDLEACQEDAWVCENCKNPYPSQLVEEILLERVNQLLLSYTLQDLRCVACGSVIVFARF